ncbi:MAG: hypothetical protein ACJ72N_15830 [Labedaea sp.]
MRGWPGDHPGDITLIDLVAPRALGRVVTHPSAPPASPSAGKLHFVDNMRSSGYKPPIREASSRSVTELKPTGVANLHEPDNQEG